MVDEGGLSDPSPGKDGYDIYLLVGPCIIQESDVFLSPKKIASCHGQSRDGNSLRPQSDRRLASSDPRLGKERLLQALTSDSTLSVESANDHRNRLQKFGWVLEALSGVFLEEHIKENDDRLRNSFQQIER